MPKKFKKIRRSRGKNRNLYFTSETQDAIVRYQECDCEKTQNEIYDSDIKPAMEKLVESLIFVYGFSTPYCTFEELKNDCVSFLYESLEKWSPDKGSKAFSYYNVVAKRWLIGKSKKHDKRMKRHVSVDKEHGLNVKDKERYESHKVVLSPDEILIRQNLKEEIFEVLDEIEKCIKNEKEQLAINAIRTVFQNVEKLEFLNKRAILVYLRDISGLPPKKLSVALSSIRKQYRRLRSDSDLELFF